MKRMVSNNLLRGELSTGISYYQGFSTATKKTKKKTAATAVPKLSEASGNRRFGEDGTCMMVDIDANLTHADLAGDTDIILQRCGELGVSKMVVPGSTVEESRRCISLAEKHPGVVYATSGVHPYHVLDCNDSTIEELHQLAVSPHVSAFGEFGLDYSPSFPDKEVQLEWFEKQLELALKIDKPLFLHEREAHDDMVRILGAAKLGSGGSLPPTVIHCFTGTRSELEAYLEMGFFIGITGYICKQKHGASLRELIPLIPLDRLFVETDAPYMGFPGCRDTNGWWPQRKRQSPNLPTALPQVIQAVADVMKLQPEDVAAATTKNAVRFFQMG